MSKYNRRRTKTQLQKRVDQFVGPVYGIRDGKDCPRRYSNRRYCRLYNERKNIFLAGFKPPIRAYDAGANLKVSASLDTAKTLLYLDTDTHSRGKSADVQTFYERLEKYFPTLPSPIIGPRGGSAWLVIDTRVPWGNGKERRAAEPVDYNTRVRDLQAAMRGLAQGLDIEFVEAKGTVYEPTFNGFGAMTDVKAGDLLKCPPSEVWLDQPAITYAGLGAIIEAMKADAVAQQPPEVATPEAKPIMRTGSVSWTAVDADELARLPELARLARNVFHDRPTTTKHRDAITAERFAEVMFALVHCKPNEDTSNPGKRFEKFITAMHEAGHFKHNYRFEVYKAVRNYLTENSLIVWHDETYCFRTHQAAKWDLAPQVRLALADVLAGRNNTQHTSTLITASKRQNVLTVPRLVNRSGLIPFERPLLILHSDLEGDLYEWRKAA